MLLSWCCSYHSGGQEIFSFAITDNLVAGGGQGDVLFWDRRMQQQLEKFDDMHMDDVTQVNIIRLPDLCHGRLWCVSRLHATQHGAVQHGNHGDLSLHMLAESTTSKITSWGALTGLVGNLLMIATIRGWAASPAVLGQQTSWRDLCSKQLLICYVA